MTQQQHLAHLSALMAPPFTWHWWPFVKGRAGEIAQEDAECAELPAMVLAEFNRLKEAATKTK